MVVAVLGGSRPRSPGNWRLRRHVAASSTIRPVGAVMVTMMAGVRLLVLGLTGLGSC